MRAFRWGNDAFAAPFLTLIIVHGQRDAVDAATRSERMNQTNPKYILRNWMSAMAYEAAERDQDYRLIQELMTVLSQPYDEQSAKEMERWYQITPSWARQLPGVAFMSCSS